MNSLYIPFKVDISSVFFFPILLAVIIVIVTRLIENKISIQRAFGLLVVSLLIFMALYVALYNIPGYFYFKSGLQKEIKFGCPRATLDYQRAIESNPMIKDARTHFVICKLNLNKAEEALAVIEPLEVDLLEDESYWADLSMIYYALQDPEKMTDAMEQMLILKPVRILWLMRLQVEAAPSPSPAIQSRPIEISLEQLLQYGNFEISFTDERETRTNAEILYQLANYFLANNDTSHFMQSIEKYLSIHPTDSKWVTDIAENFHRQRNFAQAESVLRVVRMNNLNDGMAVYWLAWTLYEQGTFFPDKYTDAINHFGICKQLVEGEFFKGRCFSGMGFTYVSLGDYVRAKEEFKAALLLYPDQQDVITALNQLP